MSWIIKKDGEIEWVDYKVELMSKTKDELVEIILDLDSQLNHLNNQ